MIEKESTSTLADSYNPYAFMSTIFPVSPLIPHECSPATCFALRRNSSTTYYLQIQSAHTLSSVKTRMEFPPAFCTNVRGMTSIASAIARYGVPSTPVMERAACWSATLIAISVAPPPGASRGLNTTFRVTDIASTRLRSISLRMSFETPRSRIVHALGW